MDIQFAAIEGKSRAYLYSVLILALFAAAGLAATCVLVFQGLHLSGMTNRIPWGVQITMAVYYIGLSAGSLVVSGLYGVFGKLEYKPFARLAAYMAMLFLIAGLLSILTDQGRMARVFIEPFTHFNLRSMFSINPILYMGHIMLCIVYLWALFYEKKLLTKISAVTVVIWAIMVHTGTGMILGFIPRELHQSALLPPSFVVAAIASGTALMILVLVTLFRLTKRHLDDDLVFWLARMLAIFLLIVMYFVFVENMYRYYLVESREAAEFYLFGGLHSWLFWVGLVTVGCIVPAIILFHRRRGRSIPWVVFASCLVVFGVLCERYVIVIPGQTNPPHLFPGMEIASSQLDEGYVDYTISIYETLQSFGVIGVIGLMFLLGLKFMALAPTEARMTERPYAREYLEGIVENSADIIITVSPRGRIETFNRGAEQSLGYHRDEVIGRRIELIFAREQDRRIALRQLADSDNVRNFATDLRTKSGEIRNVLLTLTRLRNAEGKQIGTFGISKDITEERRLLRQLIKAKKMAAIGEALTGIQHAVKNMLNALKGGAFLVNKGIEKRNRERMVEGWAMVEEGIERMSGLSSSLLTFARDWKLELKKVDVVELVDSIAGVVTETGRERGVEIETALADNLPLLRCDQKLIHIVLMDLVTNAMDACAWKDYAEGEQPRIELRARLDREGEHFYITVADNGCGMSEEVARSIFKPFFTTKEGRGTGLGLALADRIIEVHGGRIQVESDLGRGTTFRIVLPVAPSQRAEETNYVKESAYH